MKNKEKYAEDIIKIACSGSRFGVNRRNGNVSMCIHLKCRDCLIYDAINGCCSSDRLTWAESEYVERPVISKADRVLLECLKKDRKYLARDENGLLYSYIKKPSKYNTLFMWGTGTSGPTRISGCFNADFPMVKWEDDEPWLVEDLLKLEVVDEY